MCHSLIFFQNFSVVTEDVKIDDFWDDFDMPKNHDRWKLSVSKKSP